MIIAIVDIKWPVNSPNPTKSINVEIDDELLSTPGEFACELSAKICLMAGGTPLSYKSAGITNCVNPIKRKVV